MPGAKCAGPHLILQHDKSQLAHSNSVIAERIAQQIIGVVRLLKNSKNLKITRINQNNKRRQID
jgi:hypothetical protein